MTFLALAPMVPPSLLPLPVSVRWNEGIFQLERTAGISTDAGLDRAKADWVRELKLTPGRRPVGIRLRKDPSIKHAEGYRLKVGSDGITIHARGGAGFFYAAQTVKQLMPASEFGDGELPFTVPIPFVEIEDEPRFAWRGLMLDTARHFRPKTEIMKLLDVMALHKFNSFHWHLTDDQGWRIQIKRYPRLTEIGSNRKETMAGAWSEKRSDGKPYGGFYTQADIKQVVAYAAERHINVVPEIEMPGHAQAAVAAYPELGNTKEKVDVRTIWGISDNVFNPEESTIQFLQNVLTEVLELFPSKFIHIGGDECPKKEWKESARAQELIKQRGLKNEEELQSWFVRQMDTWLAARGRRLIGWDEILEGGLAPGATVMNWRGVEHAVQAVREGHDVVMSPTSFAYFDYYQGPSKSEPLAIGGFLPLEKVYSFEPIPDGLSAEEAKHILGGQGNIWTEYIPSARKMQYMAFPRASALAEVLWTPKSARNWDDFSARLPFHLDRLTAMDVNFRRLQPGK
jgi:hexosaminidase